MRYIKAALICFSFLFAFSALSILSGGNVSATLPPWWNPPPPVYIPPPVNNPPPVYNPPPPSCYYGTSTSNYNINTVYGGWSTYTIEHITRDDAPTWIYQNSVPKDSDATSGNFSSYFTQYYYIETREHQYFSQTWDYTTTTTYSNCTSSSYSGRSGTSGYTNDRLINNSPEYSRSMPSIIYVNTSYPYNRTSGTTYYDAYGCSYMGKCGPHTTGRALWATSAGLTAYPAYEPFDGDVPYSCTKYYVDGGALSCNGGAYVTTQTNETNALYKCWQFTYPQNPVIKSNVSCNRLYYVTGVDVHANQANTHEKIDGPSSATCWYKYSTGETRNCSPSLAFSQTYYDGSHQKNLKQCWDFNFYGRKSINFIDYYNQGPSQADNCSNHWYVNKVDVQYPKLMTYDVDDQEPANPNCLVYFYDGTGVTRDCSTQTVAYYDQYIGSNPVQYHKVCKNYTENGWTDTTPADNCNQHYFAYKADLTVPPSTLEDEPPAEPVCTRYYTDGTQRSCYNDNIPAAKLSFAVLSSAADKIVGRYTYAYNNRNSFTKTADTTRYLVTKVAITSGPDHAYTGLISAYTCEATFGNNFAVKDVSNTNYTWNSAPQDFIGTAWSNTGYTDPRGVKHNGGGNNMFYADDPTDANASYTVYCKYYDHGKNGLPQWNFPRSNILAHAAGPITASKKITLHGIKDLKVEAAGTFADGTGNYQADDSVNLNANSIWDEHDFLTGHWYDFRTFIQYSDGTDGGGNPGAAGYREITSSSQAPEVYWTSAPWYPGSAAYTPPKSYDTGMTESGLDHRIPVDGWNAIHVEYFNNSPHGTKGNKRTFKDNKLWAHQVTKLEIKGANYASAPKIAVTYGENVNYTAWITWSDTPGAPGSMVNPFGRGQREDWTSAVKWEGDYLLSNGQYKFDIAGTNEKATVAARFADEDRLYENYPNWESVYDKIEVTINDCSNVKHLAWKCPLPTNYWRIDPSVGFQQVDPHAPNFNFLPPASEYKFPSWNNDTNPYYFELQFPVSGTGVGSGNK